MQGLNCYYVEEKRRHEAQSNSDSRGGLRAQSVGATAVEIDKVSHFAPVLHDSLKAKIGTT